MQQLLKQNASLQQMAEKYKKQMTELQQINSQHQNQIDTLLKFNQKLLHIIEKQLNGQKLKNSDILSLQPISQKTQIQSEMFQSQFSNIGLGNQALMKRTLNLKPDPIQQKHKASPLAIVQRQQQLSIDVQGNQRQEIQQNQVKNLIKQFHKKIKIGKQQLSYQQMERKLNQQNQQLAKLKNQAINASNIRLNKLNQFRDSITETNPKQKLIQMLSKINNQQKTNKIISGYISAL